MNVAQDRVAQEDGAHEQGAPGLEKARPVVMFVLPDLSGGGAERVVTNLIRNLDRRRYRIILLLIKSLDGPLRDRIPDDVEIVVTRGAKLSQAIPDLLRRIWRLRPDLVVSNLDHLNIALGVLRPLFPPGTRLICRATDIGSFKRRGFKPMLKLALPRADGLIFQSSEMRRIFLGELRIKPRREIVLNNPVDVAGVRAAAQADLPTGFEAGAFNLVAAGRLTENKGFDLLIEAIGLLKDDRVRLTLLGEGDRAPLIARIDRLNLRDQVRLMGFQANPYVFFRAADAFVLSSRHEGFPNVVLEALACGARVVATPVPGVPELLAGIPGCVVAEAIDATAIAAALSTLIASPRIALPANAVDRFGVEAVTRRFEDYFDQVMGRAAADSQDPRA